MQTLRLSCERREMEVGEADAATLAGLIELYEARAWAEIVPLWQ